MDNRTLKKKMNDPDWWNSAADPIAEKNTNRRVIDIPGVDKEYFQDLARKLAEDDPSWLTPERKKSFGL